VSDLENLDIERLAKILLKSRKFIISLTFLVAISSVAFSLYLTPIYTSSALAEPNPNLQIDSSMSNLAGTASMIGLDISSGGSRGADIVTVSVAVIRSRDFFALMMEEDNFLPELMAASSYSKDTKQLTLDNSKYDAKKNEWIVDGKNNMPSFHDSYETFIKSHLEIQRDQKTKLTTISISHSSPYIAKKWLDMILIKINTIMRDKKIFEANKSIDFLNEQLGKTNIKELKAALSNSIEKELNSLMFAKITDDYIFKIIDSPRVPLIQSRPNKKSIVLIGTIIGLILSILMSLIYEFIYTFNINNRKITK